ncbi:MAG: SNF2 helicase associated domain-containing protein [Eubacterium sp.]|nr:SNF2 helicase associated domain-containing protein [Eubacterium sp.]
MYIAGMLTLAGQVIEEKGVGDATDRTGAVVLNLFRQHRSREVVADIEKKQESIRLEPRIVMGFKSLELSFKIGFSKMFVVKDLAEFTDAVESRETLLYGKDTYINHQMDNFTQESRRWISFISKAVEEERMIDARINSNRWNYDVDNLKCPSISLYGWRIDELYELLGEEGCEYETKEQGTKKKYILHRRQKNPEISMLIDKSKDKLDKEFHGIEVNCKLPHFYHGNETSYYIEETWLSKIDCEFMDKVQLLLALEKDDRLHFQIGRNNLQDFYYNMLPQLEDVVTVEERDKEEIEKYLPPEVKFVFYLDQIKGNVNCKVHAIYDEREISILDLLNDREKAKSQTFRMLFREEEILYQVREWFPYYDLKYDYIHCNSDEHLIFRVISKGVEYLSTLGDVQCTQAFKNRNVVQKVKVSVGVSLNNTTLDLDIMSDEFGMQELLEVLEGYRTRKKYFRLKNGDFVNLEDDNLKMLAELMETLHLPAKEFIKGKLHVPIYRTLYLDKLLEENEAVYSTRDKQFKNLIKNFKTVNESDFEEPQALSRIMRGYQKNGYKWLRMLESYGFGGILADDMGLGKTLQVIAVLAAAKEEAKADESKVSLVVAPASLVYNWQEEFSRYAPQLQVEVITGTQEERRDKIQTCEKHDVIVTSYDLLKRDIALYEDKQFAYQIIDEAQYIKNHTTAAAKAVKVIKSRTRYALTGTPIENRLSELWSIFDYLMPGFLYGYDTFKKDIETKIVKNEDDAVAKRLQKMVAPFILRRLKSDVLKDLPDKLEETRFVKIEGEQQKIYDAQVLHMRKTVAEQDNEEYNRNKIQILAELTRLRQICCDPNLCFENYRGESAKLEACLELIQSALDGGHKILLFSQFTTMLEILEKRLEEEGISFYKITGETPKEKRIQLVKSFNEDDTSVFLISLKAGGVGLNLTGADVVIHYDPWWNVAAQNQATDRAHRIGQQKKVIVYKLIVKQSVEEKIMKLQEAKQNLADKVIHGETNHLGSMSKEELLEILDV